MHAPLDLISPGKNARRLNSKIEEFHITEDILIFHLVRPDRNARGLSNKKDHKDNLIFHLDRPDRNTRGLNKRDQKTVRHRETPL